MRRIKSCVRRLVQFFARIFGHKTLVNVVELSQNHLLDGRCALVTGGTGGIGRTIAVGYLKSGSKVIIAGRDEARLLTTKDSILLEYPEFESKIDFCVMDIADASSLRTSFDKLVCKHKIDILVNNAGVSGKGNLLNITEEEFENVIRTNLEGTVLLSQVVAKYMIQNKVKGNILNISSSSSVRPAITPYMISKWGLNGFTLGLAKSLIKYDIVVNALAPGPTAAGMIKLQDNNIHNFANPSGRYLLPEEVANLAVILVSGLGRMIVGDTIYATGGSGIFTFDDVNYNINL